MSHEFENKLELYKQGKLNQNEATEIEKEIDKYLVIQEYLLYEDEEFIEEIKQEMSIKEENKSTKMIKRRVNLRIIIMTGLTVIVAFILLSSIFFFISKITTSLFGIDNKEAYVEREKVVQFAQMFQPQYTLAGSGVSGTLFAQQNIGVSLDNTLGHTKIDETEINVRYHFGKPVRSETDLVPALLAVEEFSLYRDREAYPDLGFKILEKAPQGTQAKVLIEFNKALSPEQVKDNFITPIANEEIISSDIALLATVGSKWIIGNPSYFLYTPVYPYDKENAKQLEGNAVKSEQYQNMENQAHTESFAGNINVNLKFLKNVHLRFPSFFGIVLQLILNAIRWTSNIK